MPFKKGVSGNPNGRPRGVKNFKTELNLVVSRYINPETGGSFTAEDFMQLVIQYLIKRLLLKDTKFDIIYLDLLDRIYGKP